ncbi:hypothetical protein N9609_01060 [bacterium]|nr:hypothetical protein [bacterium]
MNLKNTFWILLIIGLVSCKQKSTEKKNELVKEIKVVNANDKIAFAEFRELNLDSTYTNLLDPRNVTESEYKIVTESWSEFHKKVSKFIKEENFKWEVPDSTISIVNRIYFDKNGTIDYYGFKILNPSISAEKNEEFKKVLEKFSKEIKLELKRDKQYAQCGKTKYLNY